MSKIKENQKIQELYEDLKKAKYQIQVLTQQNIDLRSELLDQNVNEIRRVEAFKILNSLLNNKDGLIKSIIKNKLELTILNTAAIRLVDDMIEKLTQTAVSLKPDDEVKDESKNVPDMQ